MTTKKNPYVGPRSFETGEKLYGRDREVRVLTALLIAERIVLLHSPSGAGKTSLLKAGLLPKLREENFNVLPIARVNIEAPGAPTGANRYALSLMLAMEEKFPEAERLPVASLAALNLDEYLTQRAPEADTLLVLDQFEEVLTIASTDREGKEEFFNQLGSALRNKTRWALFSMREDYLGMLSPYVRPIPNRLVTRMRLDLLNAETAIEAIRKPAQTEGIDFTLPAAQMLVDDLRLVQVQQPDGKVEKQLGQYVEPVQLQVVCYRLWETLSNEDLDIDEHDLEKVGDVNEALAEYYALSIAKAAETSGISERVIREWFDRKLITPDNLRGQVRLGVEQSEGLPTQAVRPLIDAHLIRAEQRGQTWLELAHDRLVEPVRSNNRTWFQKNLSLFQRQAELWEEKNHSESLLLRGADLAQAELEAREISLTPDEKAYLKACRQLRQHMQREKWLRRGITLGFIVATAMFFVAVYFSIQASASNEKSLIAANTAEAASTEAIAQKALAEAASLRALDQQATAEAASIEAYAQKALAEAASLRALDQQATAEAASAQAEIEKAKAVEQEVIAKEQREEAQKQKLQADANSLVAQSLIQQIRLKDDLANLLAAEAFLVNDFTRTRTQMLATIYSRGRLPLAQGQSGAVITGLGYTPDNSGLVAAYFKGCQKANHYQCDRGVIRTWNIQRDNRPGSNLPISLQLNNNLIDPPGFLDAGAVSPDGSSVATAACLTFNTDITRCREESVQLWNISTRQPAGAPISITGEIASDKDVQLAFSPDGKTLAVALNINTLYSAARDTRNTISLWNLENNGKIGEFTPPGDLTTIAFSPDGKTLALAVGNGVTLLDSSSLEPMDLSAATRTRRILSLAFSPDGKTLATGADDGLITLINLQSGVPGERPLVNTSRVLALAFSPDGKILAAGYQDAGLVLWDVPGNQRLIIPNIYKHNEDPDVYPIYSLAFSPDGNQLASTSDEIIIWDMDPDSWVNKACLIAGRNFSQPEWKQFFGDEPYHQTCPQFPAGK